MWVTAISQGLNFVNEIKHLAKRGAFGAPSVSLCVLPHDMETFPKSHCDTLSDSSNAAHARLLSRHDACLLLPEPSGTLDHTP